MNLTAGIIDNNRQMSNTFDANHIQTYLNSVINSFPEDAAKGGEGLRAFEKQIIKAQREHHGGGGGKNRNDDYHNDSSDSDTDNDGGYLDDDMFDDASTIATTFTLLQQQFQQQKNVKLENLGGVRSGGGDYDEDEDTKAWEKMSKSDLIRLLKSLRVEQTTVKKQQQEPPVTKETRVDTAKSIRLEGWDDEQDYSVKVPPWANRVTNIDQKRDVAPLETTKEGGETDVDDFTVKLPPWFHQGNFEREQSQKRLTTQTKPAEPNNKAPQDQSKETKAQQEEVRTSVNSPPQPPPKKNLVDTLPSKPSATSLAPTIKSEESASTKPHKQKKGVSFRSSVSKAFSVGRRGLFNMWGSSSSLLSDASSREPQPQHPTRSSLDATSPPIPIVPQNIQSLLHSTPNSKEGAFLNLNEADSASSHLERINESWKQHYNGNNKGSVRSTSTNGTRPPSTRRFPRGFRQRSSKSLLSGDNSSTASSTTMAEA